MFKKRGFLVLFLIFSVSMVWGQTTIKFCGFEDSGDTWNYSNAHTAKWGSWGIKTSLGSIKPYEGSYFWGMNDLDTFSDTYLEFDNVDISSYNDVVISFYWTDNAFDDGDDMFYSLSYDNGSTWETEVKFLDGGSGAHSWTEQTIYISDSENQVALRIKAYQNGGADNAGWDNFKVTGTSSTPDPEPSNYPTGFTATANGYDQIDLGWTDATGETLPDGYLIKANETGTFTDPADGTDPTEDTDLSDGTALVKVAHGAKGSYSFTSLSELTTYYFKIWSYTNSGTDIDFKIDGTVPTDNATTEEAPSIVSPSVGVVFISEIADAGSDYNSEYIELYNNSDDIIDLSNSKIVMDQSTNFQITNYTGDSQIPSNGLFIMSRGATKTEFETEWGPLPTNCNYNEGSSSMYFGTDTARRWQLIYDDGTKADVIIDDTQTAVAGSGNRSLQEPIGVWNTYDSSNATPGQLDPGQTLPVTLSTFTVVFVDEQPLLQWKTQSEENNAGWNIYRGETETAFQTETAQIINFEIIPGAGTSSEPTTYEYSDVFPVQPESSYYYWLESVDYSGTTHLYGPVTLEVPEDDIPGDTPELPYKYGMQNYPNPFNPSTEISFVLPQASPVELNIYNLKGRKIRTLIAGETLAKDKLHKVVWDGTDSSGQPVSSGIYLYKLLTQEKVYTQKMLLVK
ncbi:MAG: hypothetical protein PWQ09_1507 [Candidatus Cloacimonadota bacterium]|nr:hypothetical protein [Candidatus Cloacimonadota bacterium]